MKKRSKKAQADVKHRIWLIVGIVITVLAVAFIVLFPAFKEGFAGKGVENLYQPRELVISDPSAQEISSPGSVEYDGALPWTSSLGKSCSSDNDCNTGESCQNFISNVDGNFHSDGELGYDPNYPGLCVTNTCNVELSSGLLGSLIIANLGNSIDSYNCLTPELLNFELQSEGVLDPVFFKYFASRLGNDNEFGNNLCIRLSDNFDVDNLNVQDGLPAYAGLFENLKSECTDAVWYPNLVRYSGHFRLASQGLSDSASDFLLKVKFPEGQACLRDDDCQGTCSGTSYKYHSSVSVCCDSGNYGCDVQPLVDVIETPTEPVFTTEPVQANIIPGTPVVTIVLTEICTDGVDNDGDGKVDCADLDCLDQDKGCAFVTCDNGQCPYAWKCINDACYVDPHTPEIRYGSTAAEDEQLCKDLGYDLGQEWLGNTFVCASSEVCDSGLDEDGDGKIDGADPDCFSGTSDSDNDGVEDNSDQCIGYGVEGLVYTLGSKTGCLFGDDNPSDGCLSSQEFLTLQYYYLNEDDPNTLACLSGDNGDCLTSQDFLTLQYFYLNEDDPLTVACLGG